MLTSPILLGAALIPENAIIRYAEVIFEEGANLTVNRIPRPVGFVDFLIYPSLPFARA